MGFVAVMVEGRGERGKGEMGRRERDDFSKGGREGRKRGVGKIRGEGEGVKGRRGGSKRGRKAYLLNLFHHPSASETILFTLTVAMNSEH